MWASCPALSFEPGSADIKYLKWGRFEKDLDLFFNKLKMPYAVCRIFRIGGGHHLIGTPYGKIEEMFSELWIARYRKIAAIMKQYQKDKGIEGRLIYELYDEPYDKDYSALIKCAEILRSVYPDIKLTFWSGRGIIPGMTDVINIWTVSNMSFNPSLSSGLRKQGKQVWIYNPVEWTDISMPMASTRRLFWYLWNKKVDGLFFWNISCWKEWGGIYFRANRDSTLIYPGKNEPVNTIRWEYFRDGLEDYEYLYLLKQAVDNAGTGNLNKNELITVRQAKELLREINATDFSAPESISRIIYFRNEIAAKIESLKQFLPAYKDSKDFIVDEDATGKDNVILHLSPGDFPGAQW